MISKVTVLVLVGSVYWHLCLSRRISQGSCGTSGTFYLIARDAILNEIAIFQNVTDNLADCIDFCISIAVCKAMNTHLRNDSKLDCHLLQDDHITKSAGVIQKAGWNFYDTGSSDTNRAVS